MRKIGKIFWCALLLLAILSLSACNTAPNPNSNTTYENENEKISKLVESEELKPEKVDLVPMVMVEGKLYQDTGYVNSCLKCGTPDGKITSTVTPNLVPTKNDESNFGVDFEYQFWKSPYINVKIGKNYQLFEELDGKSADSMNSKEPSDEKEIQKKPMPDAVAHFTAVVQEIEEGALLVTLTEITEEFDWIFRAKEIEKIKPISLSIENLNHSKDGRVTTHGLQGKSVEVWFDGSINGEDPKTSNPITLGAIYKVEVLD